MYPYKGFDFILIVDITLYKLIYKIQANILAASLAIKYFSF